MIAKICRRDKFSLDLAALYYHYIEKNRKTQGVFAEKRGRVLVKDKKHWIS